jgi:ribonuclease VapC
LIVVDTSALVAILREEAELDDFVRAILQSKDARIGAPTAFEYRMVASGSRAIHTPEQVERVLSIRTLRVVDWTPPLAMIAQEAFLRYGKGRHPAKLNFGDCMSYALARSLGCPLLYKGEDFARTDIASAV